MARKNVASKYNRIRIRPRPHTVTVLSRQDRRLWAGAVLHEGAARMRDDAPAGCYGTTCVAPDPEESWDLDDEAAAGFEVKPAGQTAE